MKKAILIVAIALISAATTFAQVTKAPAPPAKKDTVAKAEYKANPKRVYQLSLTEQQISMLYQSSTAGVIPFLKTTDIKLKDVDAVAPQFQEVIGFMVDQYRKQYVADSLLSIAPAKPKNK